MHIAGWQSLDHRKLEESVAKAAWEHWKNHGPTSVHSTEWSVSKGLISFCGKIYIPKDLIYAVILFCSITILLLLDIQVGGRHWNLLHEIIGGHRCRNLLVYIVAPVTPATAQNFAITFHRESFIWWRPHLNDGIKWVWILWWNFLTHMDIMQWWMWLTALGNACILSDKHHN
jgi:hypothetical protein